VNYDSKETVLALPSSSSHKKLLYYIHTVIKIIFYALYYQLISLAADGQRLNLKNVLKKEDIII
jgi:hypothetical protein